MLDFTLDTIDSLTTLNRQIRIDNIDIVY